MSVEYERHWVAWPDELADGERKLVTIGPIEVGVFRVNGGYVAWRNVCPHAGAPVCRGTVEPTMLPSAVYEYQLDEQTAVLRCPWHGWEFDLAAGHHLTDSRTRLKGYAVTVDHTGVYVELARRRTPGAAAPRTSTQ